MSLKDFLALCGQQEGPQEDEHVMDMGGQEDYEA